MPPEAVAALALRLNDDGTIHCEEPDGSAFDLDPDKVSPKLLACLIEVKEKGYVEEETMEALRAKPDDSKDSTK
jgi:hypothetical protein